MVRDIRLRLEQKNNMKNTTPINRTKTINAIIRYAGLVGLVALVAGCGHKLSGTYAGESLAFKELKFISGSKVELTSLMDTTTEATYTVEGDKVKISAAGQTQVFTLDKNGCLDGGGLIGTFCKR